MDAETLVQSPGCLVAPKYAFQKMLHFCADTCAHRPALDPDSSTQIIELFEVIRIGSSISAKWRKRDVDDASRRMVKANVWWM
jgi:hypothetical protein